MRYTSAMSLALLLSSSALAVQPQRWVHTTEADFESGESENTIVTNLGDVKLSARTREIGEAPDPVSVLYDLQELSGTLYAAAGPQGRLLKRDGEKLVQAADLDNEQLFALDVYDGKLLLALSGEPSRLAVLDGDQVTTLARLDGVRYIWDVVVEDGTILIATGTDGRVLRIDPDTFVAPPEEATGVSGAAASADVSQDMDDTDQALDPDATNDDAEAEEGEAEVEEAEEQPEPDPATELLKNPGVTLILDTEQTNILCLARNNKKTLFAGTDTDGLVYRLTPNAKSDTGYDAFVIYDAAEPEIGALLAMQDGTVYAGTADAQGARPGRIAEAVNAAAGRPAAGTTVPVADIPVEGDQPVPEPGQMPEVPPAPTPIGGDGTEGGPGVPVPPQPSPPEAPTDTEPSAPSGAAASSAVSPDQTAPESLELTPPTPQQYDRLRDVVRKRLQAARESGKLQSGPQVMMGGGGPSASAPTRVRPVANATTQTQEGNAVYRIDPDGFVTEVFRESVMILRLARDGDRLLVSTGNEGQVYRVDPAAEETLILADVEAEQIPAMLVQGDRILLATANPARLLELDRRPADEGTYTSPPMDASQVSLWGAINVTADVPEGSKLIVETRSGNVADPEQAPWSNWSQAAVFEPAPDHPPLQPREAKVNAPPARFLQYRLKLDAGADAATPAVDRVEVAYVVPNLSPKITTLTAAYPEQSDPAAAPPTAMAVTWEAADANADALTYTLAYQPAGSKKWITLADDIEQSPHEWQTQQVPDGYYLLRVTATDAKDNPGDMARTATRRSDPVLVDNTPPRFDEVKHDVKPAHVTVTGKVSDDLSPLRRLDYTLDGEEDYHPILPEDLIFDSTSETFSLTLPDLTAGPHVVTLRARDARGNTRHESILFDTK